MDLKMLGGVFLVLQMLWYCRSGVTSVAFEGQKKQELSAWQSLAGSHKQCVLENLKMSLTRPVFSWIVDNSGNNSASKKARLPILQQAHVGCSWPLAKPPWPSSASKQWKVDEHVQIYNTLSAKSPLLDGIGNWILAKCNCWFLQMWFCNVTSPCMTEAMHWSQCWHKTETELLWNFGNFGVSTCSICKIILKFSSVTLWLFKRCVLCTS